MVAGEGFEPSTFDLWVMSVERYGYLEHLEQTKSASGIARKPWERVETGNGGPKGVCPKVSEEFGEPPATVDLIPSEKLLLAHLEAGAYG